MSMDFLNKPDVVDLHTHTIASGHAYNTIQEMISGAAQRGLELLGITEHAPAAPGACHEYYFKNLHVIPRKQQGVRLLFGAELNICSYDGGVDLPDRIAERLDFCIASLHISCIAPGSAAQNTAAVLAAMEKPWVKMIGHPDDGRYPLDYDAIASAAAGHRVLLEINNASLDPQGVRPGTWENSLTLLEFCKKYRTPVVMSSDAHVVQAVGAHDFCREVIAAAGMPEELVFNDSPQRVLEYMGLPLDMNG